MATHKRQKKKKDIENTHCTYIKSTNKIWIHSLNRDKRLLPWIKGRTNEGDSLKVSGIKTDFNFISLVYW